MQPNPAFVLNLVKPVIRDGSRGHTSLPDCVPSDTIFGVMVAPDNSRQTYDDVIASSYVWRWRERGTTSLIEGG